MKAYLAAVALSRPYGGTYCVLFLAGLTVGLIPLFGEIAFLVAFVMFFPAVVAAAILVVAVIVHLALSVRGGSWSARAGHCTAPILGIVMVLFGIVSAFPAVLAYTAPQMKFALADFRAGLTTSKDNIEVISADPNIATYRTGYLPGFAAPGSTAFVVLDTTGRFADLASKGRARELAGTPELNARHYQSYCPLYVTHWIGPYYRAILDDVDGCA